MNDIKIEITCTRKITFASHQNSVPLIRGLAIRNDSTSDFENLTLNFLADPGFVTPKSWTIDCLRAGNAQYIRNPDIKLSGDYLRGLDEAIAGEVRVSLHTNQDDSSVELASASEPIELLAYNEWGGAGFMPELLAAFCVTNDPAIDKILKSASEILRQAGKSPDIKGYASGSRQRVWEIVSAIWSVLISFRLDYALPPPSFEDSGQKIRLPSKIIDSGRATCLDTALLCAAAIEQAGFNPIVVFTKGHAFVGVWLQKEQFSSLIVDDAGTLRKRIDLKELLVFETTLATQSSAPAFSVAIDEGRHQISEEYESDFIFTVDIRRARMQSIKPLASQIPQLNESAENVITQYDASLEIAPSDLPDVDTAIDETKPEEMSSGTRLDRWQKKLLDLSLRNRLLNFRAVKKSIPILCPNPGDLENRLAQGEKIKIKPIPDIERDGNRSDVLHHRHTGKHLAEKYVEESLLNNELFVRLSKKDLDSKLVEIYRTARNDMQEGGTNTLFLALGFLVWKKDDRTERKFRAPLILIPVTLKRKSVQSGFQLQLHDDEPRFNTTLLEMLRQDFKLDIQGLDKALPEDAHGVDIDGIWHKIKREVKEIEGFEVVKDIALGLFSFAKYLMWKDLVDRTDQLKENGIVQHLMETPRDPYVSDVDFPDPRSLDRDYSPKNILTPLPADSSQISAVLACAQGKDFVLIGPPGTGKSQTIANMIAHNLAKERKVLFVSEKIAALEVVYRRLKSIGLGQFCLELHSSKAQKATVLEQLGYAWEESGKRTVDEWEVETVRLKNQRDKLNKFVQRLHYEYSNGMTAYLAMGQIIYNQNVPIISFEWADPNTHNTDEYEKMTAVARRIDINVKELENISGTFFSDICKSDWSPNWQEELIANCSTLLQTIKALTEQTNKLLTSLNFPSIDLNYHQIVVLSDLVKILPDCFGKKINYAAESAASQTISAVQSACTVLQEYQDEEQRLSGRYKKQAWRSIDADNLKLRWQIAIDAWWPKSLFQKFSISKELKTSGGAKHKPDIKSDLDIFTALKALARKFESLEENISGVAIWKGFDTDIERTGNEIAIAEKIRTSISALGHDTDSLIEIRSKMKKVLEDGNDLLEESGQIGRECQKFSQDWEIFKEKLEEFSSLANNNALDQLGQGESDDWLSNLTISLSKIIENKAKLRTWCTWRRVRDEAIDLGLKNLVMAMENGEIEPGQAERAFQVNYARWWTNVVVDNDDVLRTFASAEHEDTIREFRELDDKFAKTTQKYIRACLSGNLPSAVDVSRKSELGILKHELGKKRRHLPIRQLVTKMPNTLTNLTPCLLMSPLSIAQYLPTDYAKFDVVIFDEASQITVWDAIGAIARAKQAVIVGDPKQLPPTSFFNRSDEEADEDVDMEDDLESILDECLGANIPEHKIKWHYRSRHESLIAFSNQEYYGGDLITFPSAITKDKSVKFSFVEDAIYERGEAGTNQIEAQAVVKEVVDRLKNQIGENIKETIGVVTFNSKQQRLIEDLLDNQRRQLPEIETFFSDENIEPVFVKNLESVQGDERDIMFFSLTYGPDRTGKMTMNFGPMNKRGGERRLNVAITRARKELVIFSSFRPEQIDLAHTSATGVKDLKLFMEYAERGSSALAQAIHGAIGGYESLFEEAVANHLKAKGWRVESQIGVSSFRIDIGIVHPDNPGVYLAGIECDGASYHSSATARDRDKIREQVLCGLGWKILRVWSTDWWNDAVGATDKIHNALSELLKESYAEAAAQASESPLLDIEDNGESELSQEEHDDEERIERPHSAC